MLALADDIDHREGRLAYRRYRQTMKDLAHEHGASLAITTAVFCALSPNNDYFGNLRSAATVLKGVQQGWAPEEIAVSTYKHCRDRAYLYATGEVDFMETVKGPKIRSFYRNIMAPSDPYWITIDGHMSVCWHGKVRTMKEAIIKTKAEYETIADGAREVALSEGLLANQLQAVLWFTRKRVHKSRYDPQPKLWGGATDLWGTYVHPDQCPPYERIKQEWTSPTRNGSSRLSRPERRPGSSRTDGEAQQTFRLQTSRRRD